MGFFRSNAVSQPDPDAPRGILFVLLSTILFSLLDTTAKYLATYTNLPIYEIVWLRFFIQFLLMVILIPAFGLMDLRVLFATQRPWLQIARSVFMALTTLFNFLALQYLPLAETVTILFLAPLVVALLAGPLLGEWVGWRRLIAIIVGFVGILIVVRPGFSAVHPAIGFSFAAMIAFAFFILITRPVAGRDPPLVTLFYSLLVGVFLGAPVVAVDWVWPETSFVWLLCVALGVFGALGHYVFVLAYRFASAPTLAPFQYMQIIGMVALGYMVFGDVPSVYTFIGSAIVIASGLYLFHRENLVRAKTQSS